MTTAMTTFNTATLPAWHAALVIAPAIAAGAAALYAGPRAGSTAAAWRFAQAAAALALGCAALSLAAVLAASTGVAHGVRADTAGGLVLLLVAFVGWVIVRYSRPYLAGERGERHYIRWLMATLSTVGVVVAADNVIMLALAWTSTSLALHRLLTFHGERPAAVTAAHKKFIVARAADVCMLAATLLLYAAFGTLQIGQIAQMAQQAAAAASPLPAAAQAAALLIAAAALLKCAQLPFHGWLIQVMEAPTPVSALLHAGVVNLGGFVLLRFAPLVDAVPAARTLLVVVGATTAVLAALVMTTRISIKVSLAWSTCAQMGFMLMQCGLGVWGLALLHLLAHSLYKAHAFLGAGGAVRRALLAQLTPRPAPPGAMALAAGAGVAVAMTLAAAALWAWLLPAPAAAAAAPAAVWVFGGIAALSLVPLVQAQALRLSPAWLAALCAGTFGVALATFGLHALFDRWVLPPADPLAAAPAPLWIGAAAAYGALFAMQSLLTVAPRCGLARRLYPWFYGGLFVDDVFNRVAFAVWPPPQPAAGAAPLPAPDTATALAGGSIGSAARAGA